MVQPAVFRNFCPVVDGVVYGGQDMFAKQRLKGNTTKCDDLVGMSLALAPAGISKSRDIHIFNSFMQNTFTFVTLYPLTSTLSSPNSFQRNRLLPTRISQSRPQCVSSWATQLLMSCPATQCIGIPAWPVDYNT